MRNKSKVIIIAIIVLIVMVIGILAAMFFLTDIFKTNRQKFIKYGLQVTEFVNGEQLLNLSTYFEKQMTTPYESSGTYTTKVQDENNYMMQEKEKEVLNNAVINFKGYADWNNNKLKEELSLDYTEDVKFPINLMLTPDLMAMQTDYVGSKYVATKNTVTNTTNEAEEIAPEVEAVAISQFIDVAKTHTADFIKALDEIFPNERFEEIEQENMTGYKITLTEEDLKNMLIKFLQITKEDPNMLNALNQLMQSNSADIVGAPEEELTAQKIDEYIAELQSDSQENTSINDYENSESYSYNSTYKQSNMPESMDVIVYVQNSNLSKIAISNEDGNIEIQRDARGLNIKTETLNIKLQSQAAADTANISIDFDVKGEEGFTVNLALAASFVGMQNSNAVEDYQITLAMSNEQGSIQYNHKLNRNVTFVDSVQIEDLTEENTLNLDQMQEEERNNFNNLLNQRFAQVFAEQANQLGIEQVPVLNMIPLVGMTTSILTTGTTGKITNETELNDSTMGTEETMGNNTGEGLWEEAEVAYNKVNDEVKTKLFQVENYDPTLPENLDTLVRIAQENLSSEWEVTLNNTSIELRCNNELYIINISSSGAITMQRG